MAALSTIVAVGGLALAAGGAYMSYEQQRAASRNQRKAADEQRKINKTTEARQAQQAANERRKQIREERIKRSRILQSSENTGVGGSSGELGALGGLATNLGANLGDNIGALNTARSISASSQRQADFMSDARQNMASASLWGQASNFGSSIFSSAGGLSALNKGSTATDVSGKAFEGINWGPKYSI